MVSDEASNTRKQGLKIIAVSLQWSGGSIEDTIAETGITYPVAIDADRDTWDAYGKRAYPSWAMTGADEELLHRQLGIITVDAAIELVEQELAKISVDTETQGSKRKVTGKMRSGTLRWLVVAITLMVALPLLVACGGDRASGDSAVNTPEPTSSTDSAQAVPVDFAPEIGTIDNWYNGGATTLAELRGSPVLLVFWARLLSDMSVGGSGPECMVRTVWPRGIDRHRCQPPNEPWTTWRPGQRTRCNDLIAEDSDRDTWDAYGMRAYPSWAFMNADGSLGGQRGWQSHQQGRRLILLSKRWARDLQATWKC